MSSIGVDAGAAAVALERFEAVQGRELRGEGRRVDVVVVWAFLVV